jgi:FkbM family methyltransferase
MFFRKYAKAQHDQVEQFEWEFYVKHIKPGMTLFDVGANVGEVTTLFSHFTRNDGKVHSFEPVPDTYNKLKQVTEGTGRENYVLNNFALSDQIKEMEMYVYPKGYSGWNTIVDRHLDKYGISIKPENKISIKADTLDNYCKEQKIEKIDLLKIDVEGYELDVLLGGIKLFREKRVKCCVFEFGTTTYDRGHTYKDLQKFFSDLGYRINNVVPFDPIFPHHKITKEAQFSVHFAQIPQI